MPVDETQASAPSPPGRALRPSLRSVLGALLGAHLCFGAAHIAVLPPWEGFDETGHFSSIQQLWDVGEIPTIPLARLSTVIDEYRAAAPLPYSSVAPFDRSGAGTYAGLFQAGSAVVARADQTVHGHPTRPRRFEAGLNENPVAQHPPLFHALLAPLYGMTSRLSLGHQLLILRLTAYVMAWLALVIGVVVAARYLPATTNPDTVAVVAALWPFLIPSWFPAMARLGNDTLAALLVALLWLWIAARGTSRSPAPLVVGLILGAGALTKALFLPIAAGTFGWWLARVCQGPARERTRSARGLLVCAAALSAVAAWWYLGPSVVAVTAPEAARLERMGGLASALRQHFSWGGWLSGHVAFLGMLAWSGTWSLARPPYVLFIPLMAGLLLAAWSYAVGIRHRLVSSLSWLPLWWTLPMLAGFSYHMLVHVGLWGTGRGVGGYYLHVLVAPLAGAMGLGVAVMWERHSARVIFRTLLAYALAFAVLISTAQAWLFAGLLTKGPDKFYEATGPLPGWFGFPNVIERLSVLAYPRVAVALAIGGTLLTWRGLTGAYRLVRPHSSMATSPALAEAVAR